MTSPAWREAIRLRGLPIAHGALWDAQEPQPFLDGTVRVEGCIARPAGLIRIGRKTCYACDNQVVDHLLPTGQKPSNGSVGTHLD